MFLRVCNLCHLLKKTGPTNLMEKRRSGSVGGGDGFVICCQVYLPNYSTHLFFTVILYDSIFFDSMCTVCVQYVYSMFFFVSSQ